jgi:hypothetical protein
MGVEQDERKDWTDIHPEEEKEEENALHMRKWVWRKIHELSQEMKKRRQEKGRGDGTFMYWFNFSVREAQLDVSHSSRCHCLRLQCMAPP